MAAVACTKPDDGDLLAFLIDKQSPPQLFQFILSANESSVLGEWEVVD